MNILRLLASVCFVLSLPLAQAADHMKAFPAAEKGMVRYVRQLPKQDDEADFRVEVLADKTVELEPANRYFFAGEIVRETISGCGFPRYIVSQLGPLSGTLMAIDPDEAKVKRFVGLGREPYWVRYNSRLPIVVYAPDGVEVRYRVWRASPEVAVIDKG